ncbi:MAG: polyprenyl synthetase family protein [Chthoniobacterales bacterium]|nr:polyprenyl synthetase family protein [Chthoniobacterales bacterium]
MTSIASDLGVLEEKIREQASYFDTDLEEYVTYACGSSGKRLRPALAFLAGGATGTIRSEHRTLALILELIHVASLVHDDIMDGAQLRRERPTLNAKWGNLLTVLLGDVLFAHALRLAMDFSQSNWCRRIADAAIGVCSGEMLQTQRRFDGELSLEDYYRIVEMKTGSLFAIACELGASFNEVQPEVVTALKNYGTHIGIAYQILDDCIDLTGEEKKVGKTLGTDLLGGKFTLPILMLLHSASQQEKEQVHQLLLEEKADRSQRLLVMLNNQGALLAAKREAEKFLNQAEASLTILPESEYRKGLHDIATYLRQLL